VCSSTGCCRALLAGCPRRPMPPAAPHTDASAPPHRLLQGALIQPDAPGYARRCPEAPLISTPRARPVISTPRARPAMFQLGPPRSRQGVLTGAFGLSAAQPVCPIWIVKEAGGAWLSGRVGKNPGGIPDAVIPFFHIIAVPRMGCPHRTPMARRKPPTPHTLDSRL